MNVKGELGICFVWNFINPRFCLPVIPKCGKRQETSSHMLIHSLACCDPRQIGFFLIDFFFFIVSGNIAWLWDNSHLILPKRNLGIFWAAFVFFPNLLWGCVQLVLMDHEGRTRRIQTLLNAAERKDMSSELINTAGLVCLCVSIPIYILTASLTKSAIHYISLLCSLHSGESTSSHT